MRAVGSSRSSPKRDSSIRWKRCASDGARDASDCAGSEAVMHTPLRRVRGAGRGTFPRASRRSLLLHLRPVIVDHLLAIFLDRRDGLLRLFLPLDDAERPLIDDGAEVEVVGGAIARGGELALLLDGGKLGGDLRD